MSVASRLHLMGRVFGSVEQFMKDKALTYLRCAAYGCVADEVIIWEYCIGIRGPKS